MRCGKWVVNETMKSDEILQKCGEPQSKEVSRQPVLARNPTTGRNIKTGEQVIERWYYKRGSGALPMVVKVVDGLVMSLERAD